MDLEQIMLLVQRRYGFLREIDRLTQELKESLERKDEVSVQLLMQMRAEEMAKIEECQEELWKAAGQEREHSAYLKQLLSCDPRQHQPGGSFEEKKILEIRQKSLELLKEIRELDERLNLSIGGEKSFYKKKSSEK